MFEFLNKYPDRYLEVRNAEIDVSEFSKIRDYDKVQKDMVLYYPCANDEWDPEWPDPMELPTQVTIFVGADHATDQKTRRSKTGIMSFLGSNLYRSISKM